MSSSMGLIISMLFVAITFMFGGDLLTLQAAFTALENAADAISYNIAYNANFERDYLDILEENYSVTITVPEQEQDDESKEAYGEMVDFYVTKTVDHLFIMGTQYTLTVSRTAILGSYGIH